MKSCEKMAQDILARRDEYITKRKKHRKILLAVGSAACVCLLVAGVVLQQSGVLGENSPTTLGDTLYPGIDDLEDGETQETDISKLPVKWVYREPSKDTSEENVAIVPHWEELTDPERYIELYIDSVSYSTQNAEISVDMLGEEMGEYKAIGIDEYADILHEKKTAVRAINGISTECAVAACFEDGEKYYVYVNPFYRPETLGQFIQDLSLREHLQFGKVSFNYSSGMGDSYVSETVHFDEVSADAIWDMLLSFEEKENVYSDEGWYGEYIGISIAIPILGYENIGLWLTEDGHLCTNILDTGKCFFLGEKVVQEFKEYLFSNYEGYIIKYTTDIPKAE